MIPSQRVYFLLLLLTAIGLGTALIGGDLVGSRFLNLSILLTLGLDAVLLGLTVLDGQTGKLERVSVNRLPLDRLSIGRHNPVEISVQTRDRSAILQIRDDYPSTFTASNSIFALNLPAQHTETITYTVFPAQRGEYLWGSLAVRQLGRWGLAWQQWSVPQRQTVAVYPDLVGLRSLSIRLARQTSGNVRRTRQQGIGTEFAELRDYVTGDDLRLIDWKATARLNRTLVRVLEPEQEQTLIVLLDRGRLMTAQVKGLARFDWGLNALLALALTGLQRGDRVGVGVFDRHIHTWIPPQRGQAQLPKILEQLTPIQPELLEPNYLSAATAVATRQVRRALVVVLTDIIDHTASAELLTSLIHLSPRHLPFCVTLRDPQVDAIAHTASPGVASAYARAVALDLLAQRQLALAKLKQRGVLVLDAPADQVSDRLIDRYLQLKSRNQI